MTKLNFVCLPLMAIILTACAGSDTAGYTDTDEMAQNVVSPPALSHPPDYDLTPALTPPKPEAAPTDSDHVHKSADLQSSYRLGAGDKLKITVFGEDDLSGLYLVNEEGFIFMPLIETVEALGKTVTQLSGSITAKLADGYLVNPSVAIEVAEFRPVYIMGEIRMPGSYPFVTDMSVRNAVAIAGGFTYRANEKSISVMRRDEQDQTYKTELGPDDKVLPGDIITIKERFF